MKTRFRLANYPLPSLSHNRFPLPSLTPGINSQQVSNSWFSLNNRVTPQPLALSLYHLYSIPISALVLVQNVNRLVYEQFYGSTVDEQKLSHPRTRPKIGEDKEIQQKNSNHGKEGLHLLGHCFQAHGLTLCQRLKITAGLRSCEQIAVRK